jgi:hypothetical protein
MRPSVQQPISKDKNVMARTRKYYLKNNYLTLRSNVKVIAKVSTVRDTPHYGHSPTYQISLTYLERQKNYGRDKEILFKKLIFDLEVKSQGPTKVITVCDTPPYGHAPIYQITLTYLERNNYLTFRSKVKVQRRSMGYATHRLMVMYPHTKYYWPISKD